MHRQQQCHRPHLVITTFNMLAPCYKRLHDPEGRELRERECDRPSLWKTRLNQTLSHLLSLSPLPDILLLQELWFDPTFLAQVKDALSPHYHFFLARHPSPKWDGVATLVLRQSPYVAPSLKEAVQYVSLPHNPDRVCLAVPLLQIEACSTLWIFNAHVTFPHSDRHLRTRDEEVDQLVNRALQKFNQVSDDCNIVKKTTSVIVAGDFNADTMSEVANIFRKSDFRNCYTELNGGGAYPITHFNHRHESVFVDHVFLKTPEFITEKHPLFSSIKSIVDSDADSDTGLDERTPSQLDLKNIRGDDMETSPTTTAPATPTATAPATPPTTLANLLHGSSHVMEAEAEEFEQRRRMTSTLNLEDVQSDSESTNTDYSGDEDSQLRSKQEEPSTLHLPPSPVPVSDDVIQQSRSSSPNRNDVIVLEPVASSVYPGHVGTRVWPSSFTCSDHRPVSLHFKVMRM